jgi:hypothetical protein
MKRIRHVKTIVQHVFVVDDGDSLVEHVEPPNAIPAADWPTYSSDRFSRELAEWEERERLNAKPSVPNRATRRATE